MATINYKEKYEKAVHAAMLAKQDTESAVTIRILEEIFPELKESEDVKIEEEIIEYLKLFGKGKEDYFQPTVDRWIAWLEKQGKQKHVNTVEPRFKINDKVINKETGKIWTIHWYLADTNSYYVIDEEELIHHYSEDVLESAEQKPVVIPEFRIGDIITPKGKKEYYTITDIVDGWYEFREKHVDGGIPIIIKRK